jgi:hypothetical protein
MGKPEPGAPRSSRNGNYTNAGSIPEAFGPGGSAGRNAESRQRQHHDRARDQAPTTGDGKADGERNCSFDLFC